MITPNRRLLAVGLAALLVGSGCYAGDQDLRREQSGRHRATPLPSPTLQALSRLGSPEGVLDVVAWAGYAEDGSTDPSVDWVTPFEKKTGCQVTVRTATTPEQMLKLMDGGGYDVVSASGDVSLQLVESGEVEPVNTDLVPNYRDVFDGLKRQPWNSVRGMTYGIPHGWAANLLMYRTDLVTPVPDSWKVVFDADSPYQGKITAYDSPMYIADAALYLMQTMPTLGITNPYALDNTQFAAATRLLKQQKANLQGYWDDYLEELADFKSGATEVGSSWQSVVDLGVAEGVPVRGVLPKEGATGWSDTWMVATRSQHKTCAYKWLDHIISPLANATASEWLGQAPANRKSCALTIDKDHCQVYHADDEGYFDKVWPWTRPLAKCLDGRDGKCTSYDRWSAAWLEVTG